uniref:G protein-activated inward rectifier potassium channel 3 n=1 Tax=Phallusia mammillata TaxID=59560 RepID=A0A6F9DG84_9ASCI|nr:ATP-sensitive inward rectifier potassium channel 12-like [Phallusia mammillata]
MESTVKRKAAHHKGECKLTKSSAISSVSKQVDMESGKSMRYQQHHLQEKSFHRAAFDFSNSRKSSIDETNRNCSNNSSLQRMMDMSYGGSRCQTNGSLLGDGLYHKKGVRFIRKSGHCNVSHTNLSDKPRRFISDIFTTGVDLKWRWNLFVFSAAFIVSWLGFGAIFWVSSYLHGDFDLQNAANETFRPCVKNLEPTKAFTSAFLFSLETQTTIGYGFRVVTEECPFTVIMVVFQSVFGCILDAFMIGLIMAKISRPKKRAKTLLFSNKAVINVRDGRLCLMVRVGNLRKSHLVEATIRMQFIHSRETIEGEFIPLEQIDLQLDLKNDSDRLFLVTPQTICHPIDESSPLWEIHPDDLGTSNFEVIVILEGMVEATGMTTQARASYLPDEILWGHRFQNMISFTKNNGYKVNFRHFNQTYKTPDAPWQSAKCLQDTAASDVRSMIETSLYRNNNKSSDDDTSSTRTSVRSCHNNPSSASEGRDSGYTAVEDLPRTCSYHTLGAEHNKPLTSTTSLSDDSETGSTPTNHAAASNHTTVTQLPLDSPLPSVKEMEAVLVNIDETNQETNTIRPRTSASFRKPKSFVDFPKAPSAKSSDDIRLLFIDEARPIPSGTTDVAAASPAVNDKRFDDAIDLIQHDAQGTVCV